MSYIHHNESTVLLHKKADRQNALALAANLAGEGI
jgi:hypothetical protein